MTDLSGSSLPGLADELCTLLRAYANLLAGGASPAQAVAGMDLVREAAGRFVDASITETGWGSPFNQPCYEEDDSPAATSDSVDIEIKYRVRCGNKYLAEQAVRQRLRETGRPAVEDEIDTLVGIVHTLVSIDGWAPERYNQYCRSQVFEVLDNSWSVSPATR
jgi:hypothetical protein